VGVRTDEVGVTLAGDGDGRKLHTKGECIESKEGLQGQEIKRSRIRGNRKGWEWWERRGKGEEKRRGGDQGGGKGRRERRSNRQKTRLGGFHGGGPEGARTITGNGLGPHFSNPSSQKKREKRRTQACLIFPPARNREKDNKRPGNTGNNSARLQKPRRVRHTGANGNAHIKKKDPLGKNGRPIFNEVCYGQSELRSP